MYHSENKLSGFRIPQTLEDSIDRRFISRFFPEKSAVEKVSVFNESTGLMIPLAKDQTKDTKD